MIFEISELELAAALLLLFTSAASLIGMAAFFRLQDRRSPVGRLVRGGAR